MAAITTRIHLPLWILTASLLTPATLWPHQGRQEAEAVAPKRAPGGALTLSEPARPRSATFKADEITFTVDPVECKGTDIGRLDFLYRPYCATSSDPDFGGAALEGGFTANGADPCDPGDQYADTEYAWVQTIITSHPLGGRGPGEYVDAKKPKTDPCYPFQSNDDNPAGDPFTGRSFYDGPSRFERAAEDVSWLAELMFVCKHDATIEVIGSFLWSFDVGQDGAPNDGTVPVTGTPPGLWGDATPSAIDALAKETKGTETERGWTVTEGCCCCQEVEAGDGESDAEGLSWIPLQVHDSTVVVDQVVIFPRNHPVVDFFPSSSGWIPSPWPDGNLAPPLPYQPEGAEMFQDGVLFTPPTGPSSRALSAQLFGFVLTGHDSFFDVFVHDAATGGWRSFAIRTQQLLGDMDGDLELTLADLDLWDLAFEDPAAYGALFPLLDPVFGGDLTHDGTLDPADRALLESILQTELLTDATALDSTIFEDGFESGDLSVWFASRP